MSLRKIKFGDKIKEFYSSKQDVILPQLDGYIKYFDDGGKNMSFVMDDKKIYEKYHEIWEVIRNLLKIDFTVDPVRDDIYLVAKLKIFNKINRRTFTNNAIPIEKKVTFAFQQ